MTDDTDALRVRMAGWRVEAEERKAAEQARETAFREIITRGGSPSKPWVRPPNPMLDAVEHRLGIKAHDEAAPVDTSGPDKWKVPGMTANKRAAWDSLDEATQLAVNAGDPAATLAYDGAYWALCNPEPPEA